MTHLRKHKINKTKSVLLIRRKSINSLTKKLQLSTTSLSRYLNKLKQILSDLLQANTISTLSSKKALTALIRKLKPDTPHRKTIYAVTSAALIALLVVFDVARASDLLDNWTFSNAADYTYDNSTTEVSGNSVRLKAQEYGTDANTAALYHFNDGSGATAADSSGNSNNATLTGTPSWNTNGRLNGDISLNGTTQFASAADSALLSLSQHNSLETNFKLSSSFGTTSNGRQTIIDKGSYKLYLDNRTGKLTYELENSTATSWSQVGGNDSSSNAVNNSWENGSKDSVKSQLVIGSNLYVGTGSGDSDAEVWRWNGSSWTKFGGDGLNGSWNGTGYQDVYSMANNGNTLYVGLGNSSTTGYAEIWSCDVSTNCTSWTKLSGWGNAAAYVGIYSLAYYSTSPATLYIGTGGSSNGSSDFWAYTISNNSANQVGGDTLGSSWGSYRQVSSIIISGTVAFVSTIGGTGGQGEVWRRDLFAGTWTKLADAAVNGFGSGYENVNSLTYFGGFLYASTGISAGDGDVWKCTANCASGTPTWSQIGGDATGWVANTEVDGLTNDGTNVYASVLSDGIYKYNGSTWSKIATVSTTSPAIASDGTNVFYHNSAAHEFIKYNGTATQIGDQYVNGSWGAANIQQVTSFVNWGGNLYAGLSGGSWGGQIWKYNGSTWSQAYGGSAGALTNGSQISSVCSMTVYNNKLYFTTNGSSGGALVNYDGNSTFTNVATGLTADSSNDACGGMAVYGGNLYFTDAHVLKKYNGTTVTTINDFGSPGCNYQIPALNVYNNKLYIGLQVDNGFCGTPSYAVYSYDGATVAGAVAYDSATTNSASSFAVYNNKLYFGTGRKTEAGGTNVADVYSYDGTTTTLVGGHLTNSSWDTNIHFANALTVYNGKLYAGIGSAAAGDGEVWKYDGSTWTKTAGDNVNSSWVTNKMERVYALGTYNGKLYTGTGNTTDSDAEVWSMGGNGVVQSTTTSWDTNWHHVAATYDGTNMKLYVDGTLQSTTAVALSMPDNAQNVLIGAAQGSYEQGTGAGLFAGEIDEMRISNEARSSFTSKPYVAAAQTVSTTNAIRLSGVWHWDSFTTNETANGGSINYQLSDDNGVSWKYFNAGSWQAALSSTNANSAAVVNTNISTFPVTFSGLKWRAILQGDGTQQVTLSSVSVASTSDSIAPSANASSITAKKVAGGDNLTAGAWTNGSTPYFSWTAGTDASSGIKGYCLYLGTDSTGDPVTTKGLLGTSPVTTGGYCQFIVSGTTLDTATSGYLATALTTSNSAYYLNVKAIDNAGNTYPTSTQFSFKFDNTPPTNPAFISSPSSFITNKNATLTWSTGDANAASDANSGVAGLQYKIGNTTWYGDLHLGSQDSTDLLTNDGSYTTVDPTDYNNLTDGTNIFYFRTWDAAGNVTTSYVTAELKINTSGAPSSPQNLTAVPSSNTTNSFAFSWNAPATYVGSAANMTYCYTVNAVPTAQNCTFTAAGVTSLSAGAYATQPGDNTMYVVAKDESGNINYATYASVVFNATTSAPGIPLNVQISDVSIRSSSTWKLAITWNTPSNVGIGVSTYKIYRSTDGATYTQIASSASTDYVDTGLSQITYYYRIRACDSTNNCSADSSVVSMKPTGKYTSPANMVSDKPTVSDISTRKATVTWTTDRESDSRIQIGTQSGQYSANEVTVSDQVTSHKITLDNLSAGTVYYAKVKWTDIDGNTGISGEFSFVTVGAPSVGEVTTSNINLSGANINFSVKNAAQIKLYYGRSDSFGAVKNINTSSADSSYTIPLEGLDDGTKYFFKIDPIDNDGFEYSGNVYTFSTPARPHITNLTFQPIEGEPTSTQRVNWKTNVPATSQVSYGISNQKPTEIIDSNLTTDHEIIVRGLADNSEYGLIASSRDANGNIATSDKQIFRTALDTRPPKISDVTVESSIRGVGSEARGQLIISWKSDEPSTSQVAYSEGTVVGSQASKSNEETSLSTEHTVVISNLSTSKVYSVVVLSADKAGNVSKSEPQTTIVGRASESVLTIIINSLSSIFRWIGK